MRSSRVSILAKSQRESSRALPSILLHSPQPYQVFQRAGATGDILISGHYAGRGGIIQVRFNGGEWATVATKTSPGEFTGTLEGQTEGQGVFELRVAEFPDDVLMSVNYVGIGDIFIIAGQSNAVGRCNSMHAYSHATLKAAIFGNDYRWHECIDPIDSTFGQIDPVSYDSETNGSIWPLIATSIMADQGVPVAFVPCALSGTVISAWQPGADHQDRTTLYGSCLYRILQIGGAKAVLYWQGETDAANGVSQATYNAALDTLANAFYADAELKLMPCVLQDITLGEDESLETPIRLAVIEAWTDNANVLVGPNLFAGGITSDDENHVRTDVNAAATAALWWSAISAALY